MLGGGKLKSSKVQVCFLRRRKIGRNRQPGRNRCRRQPGRNRTKSAPQATRAKPGRNRCRRQPGRNPGETGAAGNPSGTRTKSVPQATRAKPSGNGPPRPGGNSIGSLRKLHRFFPAGQTFARSSVSFRPQKHNLTLRNTGGSLWKK